MRSLRNLALMRLRPWCVTWKGMTMKVVNLTEDQIDKLGKAYLSLVEWIHGNAIDGESTMSMLFKAAMTIAVSNNVPRDEVISVAGTIYDMEKFYHPTPEDIH